MYQGKWPFPNLDMGRKKAFQILDERFKDHKSKLYVEYIKVGSEPFDKYSSISEEDWEIFTKSKQDEAFQV